MKSHELLYYKFTFGFATALLLLTVAAFTYAIIQSIREKKRRDQE